MSLALDIELAYVAGFFDGEGSITITTRKRGDLFLNVVLVQTDRDILEWVRAVLDCGGSIYSRSRAGSLGKKECFALQWSGLSAGSVLLKLLPHLRVKKSKAAIAIEFQSTMKRRGVNGTPENVLMLRENLRRELKEVS